MQNNYLIPANTKKSQLILGFFTVTDLVIFIIGCVWSFVMLLLVKSTSLGILILIMLPALISAFLVMPVPHYHNVLQLITNFINYITNRRIYYWKGWSMYEGFDTNNK